MLRALHAAGTAQSTNGQARSLKVYDARSKLAAQANTVLGGGYEKVESIGGAEVVEVLFLGIQNIHAMRQSLQSLSKLCRAPGNSEHHLESCDWAHHISLLLQTGMQIARVLEIGHPVLVHCSDGWDRTSQLVALAQILLDPFFRTIDGFRSLVEKDFCAFGHMFERRNGLASDADASPIFLQWLDCVWQLLRQVPAEFEFNESFLSFLATAHTSSWFGTFLSDCEKDRRVRRVAEDTISVWECVRRDENAFRNKGYMPSEGSDDMRASLLSRSHHVGTLHLWPHFLSEHALYNPAKQCSVRVSIAPWSAGEHAPEGAQLIAEGRRSVPPKDSVRIDLETDRTAMFWWKFKTVAPANTINFSIQAQEGKDIVSRKKYRCLQPVTGNCLCVAGNYSFIFDNEHSLLQTKGFDFEIHKVTYCTL